MMPLRGLWFSLVLTVAAVGASHACARALAPPRAPAVAPSAPAVVCTAERPRRRCF